MLAVFLSARSCVRAYERVSLYLFLLFELRRTCPPEIAELTVAGARFWAHALAYVCVCVCVFVFVCVCVCVWFLSVLVSPRRKFGRTLSATCLVAARAVC